MRMYILIVMAMIGCQSSLIMLEKRPSSIKPSAQSHSKTRYDLANNEEMIIETYSMGCFHSFGYRTTIKRSAEEYMVCVNALVEYDKYRGLGLVKEKQIRKERWDDATFRQFISAIKEDSLLESSTMVNRHKIYFNKDTLIYDLSYSNYADFVNKYLKKR